MIDLCIVSYNTKDKLKRLIDTLSSDYKSDMFNLYVLDNNSTDGSQEYLTDVVKPMGWPGEIILSSFNYGYSFACNLLASRGKSNVLGLLNADVWLRTQDVNAIESRMYELDVDIYGPKQRDEMGRITHAGIFGTNTKPQHRGWKAQDPEDQLFRDTLDAVTVSGSAYFVKRTVWENLTYDPEYINLLGYLVGTNQIPLWSILSDGAFLPTPHYYEETWCSYYARHRGYSVVYDGYVSIGHSWHASSDIGGEQDSKFKVSQSIFRDACDYMRIEHD
jgi:glycosyltransferase involved in cell wall biosynthesis